MHSKADSGIKLESAFLFHTAIALFFKTSPPKAPTV
jgi:hypothetical protein